MTMAKRLELVERRIAAACERSGRSRDDIQIIAVTKYVSVDTAKAAFDSGLEHLGENRWQDAKAKWEAFHESAESPNDEPIWHFIGTLQTNKVKEVIGKFTYIHSLDRLSLAEALQSKASLMGITVPCFLQVNVSGEASKHGMEPRELPDFLQQLQSFPALKIIGLMTMAPHAEHAEDTRAVFRGLRELRDEMKQLPGGTDLTELSMGMSNDFEIAIEEGATWVRLGTILVGKEEE
ncbi:YggS family pyridoxal phosphate-dependent enzyme [Paenibacillus sp. HB172176]|uniref:YggS family pyridoxal phosphate-dependent enzyme n=1 Tax=Paenibacillus sp. HB172176 TaxID=2493690 RepID=UPI001981E49E|nr:YggS family pyridoxal phosphate-dependent enzyme [Paenibacillus sp. HB172176]